ncbi:MAG TPA: alpha/beta hydrolase [Hyphomicrobiaceae bacterium]|jgi:triacylglycerol lipase|nr:alpha/beta hydrolase [Hyphomicrobiaceae bacterium]
MPNKLRAQMLGTALLLGLTAVPTAAQTGGMPLDIAAKLVELGPVINPPETAKLYASLHEKEPYQGVKVTRDIKFGPDEQRQALDVFVADSVTAVPRPVLMFVHGGGFLRGGRRTPDTPFYDNIMLFAARNGMVGVNTTYRLAPQHPWPAGAEDVAAAVRWVNENIAAHGGDATRVFLWGHSAGAVHVATYVAHREFHGPKGIGLAGSILMSGLYDLTVRPPGEGEKAYFGEDSSKYAERSSLHGLVQAQIPLMVVHAELDPDLFQQGARQLNEALCKAGRCPRFVALAKHSHMSEGYAINTKDTSLSGEVQAFVAKK